MKLVSIIVKGLGATIKTLRLALPKLGVGWMFALLTINLNRISIVELSIPAIAITAMLAMHYFLSPFQVITGRLADKHPILGLRRTPYLILSGILGSLVFVALPSTVFAMSNGSVLAYAAGFILLILFGIAIAVMGDSHHSLIAEVTTPKSRGGVISVVWSFTILSTIISAVVFNMVLPEYTPEAMQRLYNLTPPVVIFSILLGVVGMEKRLTGEELTASIEKAARVAPAGNPIQVAIHTLRENKQAKAFFAFVFVSIFSIFLQDNILEVFGAEVFNMPVTETTKFQPTWGGGVLGGMFLMGAISVVFPLKKRIIAFVGCAGTAVGMSLLAFAALTAEVTLVTPSLALMGLFTGFFNVGALSMMMDMTVEGATGLYMGLWGMAQAFGNGAASFGGGALHTIFIGSGLLTPASAYFTIFGIEAVGMGVAAYLVWQLSVKRFHDIHETTITQADAVRAMEAGAIA